MDFTMLTVAICTYRRFDKLVLCIDSLRKQTIPLNQFKLLIIDNSLQYDKSKKFKKSLKDVTNLEYVITDKCGIAFARNEALKFCNTDLIAFTDDDCIVPENWIESIINVFNSSTEAVAVIGGRIKPQWEIDPPEWLKGNLLHALALIDWGEEELFITHNNNWLLTANAAYRTNILRRAGGFPEHLGRKRNLPLSLEEFAANQKIRSLGYDLLYSPLLEVEHFIPKSRMTINNLCRDAFWDGVSQVLHRYDNLTGDTTDKLSETLYPIIEDLIDNSLNIDTAESLSKRREYLRKEGYKRTESIMQKGKTIDPFYSNAWPTIFLSTVCFNSSDSIDNTIISVLSQAGDLSIRYHIQDCGSTDGTVEKIIAWRNRLSQGVFPLLCKNIVFTCDTCPDLSQYDALKKNYASMSIPPNAFMTWLNSGDILLPGTLAFIKQISERFIPQNLSWLTGSKSFLTKAPPLTQSQHAPPTAIVREGLCDGIHWYYLYQHGIFFRYWLWRKATEENVLQNFRFAGDWKLWHTFAQYAQLIEYQQPLVINRLPDTPNAKQHLINCRQEIEKTIPEQKRSESLTSLLQMDKLTHKVLERNITSVGEFTIVEKECECFEAQHNKNVNKTVYKHDYSFTQPISNKKHRLNYSIIQKPIKNFDNIMLSEDWYRVPFTGDNKDWYSATRSGILYIKSIHAGTATITINITTNDPNGLIQFILNDQLIKRDDVNVGSPDLQTLTIKLKKGINILQLNIDRIRGNNVDIYLEDKFMISIERYSPPVKRKINNAWYHKLKIEQSGLFFKDYYSKQYIDDIDKGMSALEHYFYFGAWENKDPSPMFSSSYYLVSNQDVLQSGINPLLHYIQHGWKEERDPHPDFVTKRYLNAYADVRKSGMNPLFHYLKYGIMENRSPCPPPTLDIENFKDFTFSRQSHWSLFDGFDVELYGKKVNKDECNLKEYQDLFVFLFIKAHVSIGSSILDIGGGHSRILSYFSKTHTCCNIDKFEGLGDGPTLLQDVAYKTVFDYMGNFSDELDDNSFDLVFSISALEHTPEDSDKFDDIIEDINRVLKPGGYSLHLFDILFRNNDQIWANGLVDRIMATVSTINKNIRYDQVKDDPDLYCMSEFAYNRDWLSTTQQRYSDFGKPASLNILWRKPL